MGIESQARARVTWPQEQFVLPGGEYDVHRDDRDGAIDYATAINPGTILAWPDGEAKVGDGLGPDGAGPDGQGWAGAGDGYGLDGYGPDGYGVAALTFVTALLLDGLYTFAVVAADAAGNALASASVTAVAHLAGDPLPPEDLAADSYDNGTDTLTLSFTLSEDDDG